MKSLDEMQADRPVNRERVEELKREMLAQTRGYRLREMREVLGMSPEFLANTLQGSTLLIEQIENGDLEHLPIGLIRAYVEAVGWGVAGRSRSGRHAVPHRLVTDLETSPWENERIFAFPQ